VARFGKYSIAFRAGCAYAGGEIRSIPLI
jgi:hypothetical protein